MKLEMVHKERQLVYLQISASFRDLLNAQDPNGRMKENKEN